MRKNIHPKGDNSMNETLKKRLILVLAACLFTISTIFIVGCAGTKIKAEKRTGDNSGYHKAENKHKKGGPPAHAPAHGYRAKHKYRYYPDCSVYHDAERGLYFYFEAGDWKVGVSLPDYFRMELGESVSLELDADRPYIYHADHVKAYPPGQMKKSKHKKDKNNKNNKNKWG